MLDLYLIRHGYTEGDEKNVIECNADFGLTEMGLNQAALLGKKLKEWGPFDRIYCSGLSRAIQTADAVSKCLGIPVKKDPRLNEKNVGEMAGLPRAEAFKKYPEPPGGMKLHHKMGGGTGESMLEMEFRVREFFSELCEHEEGKKVIVISHGGTNDKALRILTGASKDVIFGTGNCGIHHLQITEKMTYVGFLNYEVELLK